MLHFIESAFFVVNLRDWTLEYISILGWMDMRQGLKVMIVMLAITVLYIIIRMFVAHTMYRFNGENRDYDWADLPWVYFASGPRSAFWMINNLSRFRKPNSDLYVHFTCVWFMMFEVFYAREFLLFRIFAMSYAYCYPEYMPKSFYLTHQTYGVNRDRVQSSRKIIEKLQAGRRDETYDWSVDLNSKLRNVEKSLVQVKADGTCIGHGIIRSIGNKKRLYTTLKAVSEADTFCVAGKTYGLQGCKKISTEYVSDEIAVLDVEQYGKLEPFVGKDIVPEQELSGIAYLTNLDKDESVLCYDNAATYSKEQKRITGLCDLSDQDVGGPVFGISGNELVYVRIVSTNFDNRLSVCEPFYKREFKLGMRYDSLDKLRRIRDDRFNIVRKKNIDLDKLEEFNKLTTGYVFIDFSDSEDKCVYTFDSVDEYDVFMGQYTGFFSTKGAYKEESEGFIKRADSWRKTNRQKARSYKDWHNVARALCVSFMDDKQLSDHIETVCRNSIARLCVESYTARNFSASD